MSWKNRVRIALASIRVRRRLWRRTIVIAVLGIIMLLLSSTVFHSIHYFLNDYLLGEPAERSISVGVPNESTEDTWKRLQKLALEKKEIEAFFVSLEMPILSIQNKQELMKEKDVDTNAHRYGSVLIEHNGAYDSRYLKDGRWFQTGERDVVVIPDKFAPNLEDDTGEWNLRQTYIDGKELIGKEMIMKIDEAGNNSSALYKAKIIGTYDNLRSGGQSGTIIIPYEDAQRLANISSYQARISSNEEESLYTYFEVIVKEKGQVPETIDFLESNLAIFGQDITGMSGKGTLEIFSDVVGFLGIVLGVFLLFLTVILTISTYDRMLELRKRELGVFAAIGYENIQIKRNLMTELFLIGGIILSCAFLVSGIVLGFIHLYLKFNASLLVSSIPVKMSWISIFLGCLLSFLVPWISGIKSLRRLSQQEIVEALRAEE